MVALLMAVGTEAHLDQFRRVVGSVSEENLMKASGNVAYRRVLLTHKRLLGKPVQELGLHPFQIHGLPVPVRLGRAGGLLVLHMPINANRELGIILFLSNVGLLSGGSFVETVFSSQGGAVGATGGAGDGVAATGGGGAGPEAPRAKLYAAVWPAVRWDDGPASLGPRRLARTQ